MAGVEEYFQKKFTNFMSAIEEEIADDYYIGVITDSETFDALDASERAVVEFIKDLSDDLHNSRAGKVVLTFGKPAPASVRKRIGTLTTQQKLDLLYHLGVSKRYCECLVFSYDEVESSLHFVISLEPCAKDRSNIFTILGNWGSTLPPPSDHVKYQYVVKVRQLLFEYTKQLIKGQLKTILSKKNDVAPKDSYCQTETGAYDSEYTGLFSQFGYDVKVVKESGWLSSSVKFVWEPLTTKQEIRKVVMEAQRRKFENPSTPAAVYIPLEAFKNLEEV